MLTFYMDAFQSVYVDRAGAKDQRDESVDTISARQELIETAEEEWPPILLYAEGTCTNGRNLSRFRRGAFAALKPMRPQVIKYDW